MKTTRHFLIMALSALVFGFAGCSKEGDDNGTPDSGLTAEQLKADILGKWTFNSNVSLQAVASVSGVSLQSGLARQTAKPFLLASLPNIMADTPPTGNAGGFIEFLEDGTFFILDAQGNFFTGTYTAKAGQTIDLSGFGSIKEIKFADGRIDFMISYTRSGQTHSLEIRANKAADIPASERTTLLCRTWELERIIEGWDAAYLEEQQIVKVTFLFSPSGTLLAQFFKADGTLVEATMEFWKWHPTNTNQFVGWTMDDDEESVINILKLTQSQLELVAYDEDGDVDSHFVFKAMG